MLNNTFSMRTSKDRVSSYKYRNKYIKKLQKLGAALLITAFAATALPTSAHADVLGTHISAESEKIAPYTTYRKSVFDDSSVGRQTEHYVEYTPNGIVHPILTNGWSAFGKRTVLQAADVLRQQGYNPSMGMNADFFSFQTGVPMSNTIIDGRIYTADSTWRPGIGFRANGTAFCATFPIYTTVTCEDGSGFQVECINKYRQPYALYLFNSDFSDKTHSPGKGIDAVLGSLSGELKIGGEITAVVESISENDGSVPIPDGKMILSVSADASDELRGRIAKLSEGQTIKITTTASENQELWESAIYGLGALGGKLITNGQLDYEDESAAPRTAVGIKPNGNIIFYTIDGRQSGYSYGARKETVARRLLELGCVEAISLDGGGSTQMAVSGAGSLDMYVVNSPSDGALRSCANFLFLTKPYPNGIPYELFLENDGSYMLSGSSVSMAAVIARDSSYTETDLPSDIEYRIDYDAETPDGIGRSSHIDENGYLTVYGNGDVYVSATGGEAEGHASAVSVSTPDKIELYDSDYGYMVNELSIGANTRVNLTAKSFWGGRELVSDNSCYRWTLVSNDRSVGTLDDNGVFTASENTGATGTLAVSAGICSIEIPVTINGGSGQGEDSYPSILVSAEDCTVRAKISGEGITKDSIKISIDSKSADFEFDGTGIRCALPDDRYHRVCITVTAAGGLSAVKMLDAGSLSSVDNVFSDTTKHWGRDYISYLASCGTVNGSLEGEGLILFNPDNRMKRVEFAIMMCNYLGVDPDSYADTELPFIDKDDIPWWAENKVKAVYSLGIMQGQLGQYGTSFNPNAVINRMEFAISLNRMLPKGLKSSPISAADAQDIPFWAEESMKTAVSCGIMSGYPDGTLRPLQGVTRAEAAKMLFNVFGI